MKIVRISGLFSFLSLTSFFVLEVYASWEEDDRCDRRRVAPNPKYSYEGDAPLHWDTLNPEYKKCNAGRRQSPINVVPQFNSSFGTAVPVLNPFKSVMRFGKDSHNYDFECANEFHPCGNLYYSGVEYKLIQIHSHSPSEHRINGKQYPLELHFVHRSSSGQLAVFGTLFNFGRYNQELQHIIDAATKRHYAVVDMGKLSGMISSKACRYDGSLTTPPCTEGVRWMVSLNVMQASLRQVGQYREQLGDSPNSRPI